MKRIGSFFLCLVMLCGMLSGCNLDMSDFPEHGDQDSDVTTVTPNGAEEGETTTDDQQEETTVHTCSFSDWKQNALGHWQQCSCGEMKNVFVHSFGEWEIVAAATETENGSRVRVCSVCSFEETVVIPALNHVHTYGNTLNKDAVSHWYECSCGEKQGLMLHTFGPWTVIKEATGTAEGLRERTCTTCFYREEGTIPVLGHTHTFRTTMSSNESFHWFVCACGETKGLAGHSFGSWVELRAATETEAGQRERICSVCTYKEIGTIPVLSHVHAFETDWRYDTTGHWHACNCGEKQGLSFHQYGEWTVTKEATETEEGSRIRTCTDCTYQEVAAIPMLGHTHVYSDTWSYHETGHWQACACGETRNLSGHVWGNWTVTKDATCSAAGLRVHTCSFCSYQASESIPALPHTPVADSAVEANCKTTGLSAGSHCGVCSTVLVEQMVLPIAPNRHDRLSGICGRCGAALAYPTHTSIHFGDSNGSARDYIMLVRQNRYHYLYGTQTSTDAVPQAAYKRNQRLETMYHIDVKMEQAQDGGSGSAGFRTKLMAATNLYDLMVPDCWWGLEYNGCAVNLASLGEFHEDESYWLDGYRDAYWIHNRLYTIVGDANLELYENMEIMAYNKVIAEEYDLNLYRAVQNGTWTLEYVAELADAFDPTLMDADPDNDLYCVMYDMHSLVSGLWSAGMTLLKTSRSTATIINQINIDQVISACEGVSGMMEKAS
ncbi:MAG: hypothetical protein IJY42_00150, partial [Clostridia bacterium]|nr:hypothetical protein [Clostridia bacterium]